MNDPQEHKKFDIVRVENRADNPFIRARIFGGRKDGLNIQFTTFDEDILILNYKVMTYFSERNYKLAALAWSSPMNYLDTAKKPYHQSILLKDINKADPKQHVKIC